MILPAARRCRAVLFLLLAFPALAESFRSVPLLRTGAYHGTAIAADIFVTELREGGTPEIAGCSGSAVYTIGRRGTASQMTWVAPSQCTSIAAGDRNGDGEKEIIAGTKSGSIEIFDPRRNIAPQSITLPGANGVKYLAYANVDADPAAEIVAVTASDTYVYDAATLALEWTATGYTGWLGIADIDGDGKNEILLSTGATTNGYVLDAYTQTLKSTYASGFGLPFRAADLDGDGKAEIVGYTPDDQIHILHYDTQAVTSFAGQAALGIIVADINADGTDDIIGFRSGAALAYNKTTGAEIWRSNQLDPYALAIADVDGDGVKELVSAGWYALTILDLASTMNEAELTISGGIGRVAAGDLDGDGRKELVVSTAPPSNSYLTASTSTVGIHDAATGTLVRSLSIPFNFHVSRIAIGQTDADAAREIVILGQYGKLNTGNSYYGYLYVYDGVTGQLEYSAGGPNSTSPSISYNALLVANLDSDPVDEIVFGRGDSKIEVRNGASDVQQYLSSTALAGLTREFALADTNGDTIPELLVAEKGVSIFNTNDWSQRPGIPQTDAVMKIAATSGELLYVSGTNADTVVAVAGDTLQERWRCTLPAPAANVQYATINGAERAVVASTAGELRLYPKNGTSCPTPDTIALAPSLAAAFAGDVTGDGAADVLAAFSTHWDLDLLSTTTAPRGDVNNDGQVNSADLDALARFLYNGGAGAPATADVNGDGCIVADDFFYLVNYLRGTGAPPP